MLASLTLILGLLRSSFSRWLCSTKRRNLSSDIDCFWGREFILGKRAGVKGCKGRRRECWQRGCRSRGGDLTTVRAVACVREERVRR